MKKAPPNRTGPEIWHDMMVWDAQRRRLQMLDGKCRIIDLAEYLRKHPPKSGDREEQEV